MVSVGEGITAEKQTPGPSGGLAVEEDRGNGGGGGEAEAGRLGDLVIRGSLLRASPHISPALPVSNLVPRP